MAKNRKASQEFIIKMIDELAPGGENKKIYEDMFAKMNDAEYDRFIKAIEDGSRWLVAYEPNGKNIFNVRRNLELAKKLGHEFFQRILIGKKGNRPAYLTPIKYLVVDLPFRRASQMLKKKIGIPDHNKSVDLLTGQPAGDSKGSCLTFPELQIIASMGLDNAAIELIKYRGGDSHGFRAMNTMISRYGKADLKTLSNYAGGVDSARLLKTYLTAAHLSNTL